MKCQYCGNESEDMYCGYLSMTLPIVQMEEKIDKWGRTNWWENLKQTDLTEEEQHELDQLSFYDQLLNTVGKGCACVDCLKEEEWLLNMFYPTPPEIGGHYGC